MPEPTIFTPSTPPLTATESRECLPVETVRDEGGVLWYLSYEGLITPNRDYLIRKRKEKEKKQRGEQGENPILIAESFAGILPAVPVNDDLDHVLGDLHATSISPRRRGGPVPTADLNHKEIHTSDCSKFWEVWRNAKTEHLAFHGAHHTGPLWHPRLSAASWCGADELSLGYSLVEGSTPSAVPEPVGTDPHCLPPNGGQIGLIAHAIILQRGPGEQDFTWPTAAYFKLMKPRRREDLVQVNAEAEHAIMRRMDGGKTTENNQQVNCSMSYASALAYHNPDLPTQPSRVHEHVIPTQDSVSGLAQESTQ
ncbi:hypothetical protein C8R45DRAFT_924184 [Mycena sanguinolenta]|nr:hypothetical protein C8R45DRAFT_924184 [Mycena sanguinolenta]